jgi:chemotaxis-related protein WspB
MLAVVFEAGDEAYALPVQQVQEVLPRMNLRRLAGAPEFVRGVFSYRGRPTPVLDLCMLLCGRNCSDALGTRLLIVEVPSSSGPRPLAIAAERVTRIIELDASQLSSAGLEGIEPPFLGDIAAGLDRMVQLVRPADLLPLEWRDKLLSTEEGSAS